MLWLPSLFTVLPLLVPVSFWVCLVAAVWLLVFVLPAGFSVGMFYFPAALAMLFATLSKPVSPGQGALELRGAVAFSAGISLGLAVVTTAGLVVYMRHTGGYYWYAYAFVLVPVLAATPPLWWRKPESLGAAAALVAACAFFPITIEIGGWHGPAVLPMMYAAIVENRRRTP